MRQIVTGTLAVASAVIFTGCQMCTTPIPGDPSCVEPSHIAGTSVLPAVIEYSKPMFAPTKDVFRPVYKAGTKRVSAIGSGNTLEDATADAVTKILSVNNCDYIVAVTRLITKKTHPAGFFRFPTTNYTVTLSGLPIFLEKLEKETIKEKVVEQKTLSEQDVIRIIENFIKLMPKPEVCPPPVPHALVKLTDIQLNMTAKANSNDPVAIAVPAPKCPVPAKK